MGASKGTAASVPKEVKNRSSGPKMVGMAQSSRRKRADYKKDDDVYYANDAMV